MSQRSLPRERAYLLAAGVLAIPALWWLARTAGPFTDRPWAAIGWVLPLGVVLVVLGRPLVRERRILLGGGYAIFFLAYFAFFALAAGTRLLDGRRAVLPGYEQQAPSNFLGMNRLGDWRYRVARRAPPALDMTVITLPSFERRPLVEVRRVMAGLIRDAIQQSATGIAFDYFPEDPSEFDAALCFWIERAKQSGVPVVFGYRTRLEHGVAVRVPPAPELRACLDDSRLASLIGVLEADGRVRMVPVTRPGDFSAPSLSLAVARLMRGGEVRTPTGGLLQFLAPASGPARITELPDTSEVALLRDRFVFVGSYRPGEIRNTPFGPEPGVVLHAWAAHALRTETWISRLPMPWTLALLFVLCFMLSVVQARGRGLRALVGASGMLAFAVLLGAALAMRLGNVWVDVAYPLTALALLTAVLAGGARWQQGRLRAAQVTPTDTSTPPGAASAPPAKAPPFDVFVSYNARDREPALEVADRLRRRNLRVWIDVWELVPGRPWQEAVEEVIRTTRSAAILIGEQGLGPWEIPEMRACLEQCVQRNMPVIPVLLKGAPERPDLPLFLAGFTWVDLREAGNPRALDRLEWGITGLKPRAVA